VIRRATQSSDYWGKNFSITANDLEHLLNLFMEDELPRSGDELALEIIRYRCQREETAISRELAKGKLFQPKQHYELGERLVFPALEYAVGEVIAIRPGTNPEYGDFNVLSVRLEDNARVREFACDFPYPHRLNEDIVEAEGGEGSDLRSPEELHASYSVGVGDKLVAKLRDGDFVCLFGKWFPRALLAELNIGHLNLAEAVLDMAGGGPLPTEKLLKDVGLPAEINPRLQEFSLNYALSRDERFDEVGSAGEVLWFLRRLEPPEALFPPKRLIAQTVPYRRDVLDEMLLGIERELDDEYSDLPPLGEDSGELGWILTYPHRRVGSVPLSKSTARLFPTGRTPRIRFLFEDARSGKRWPGWVVREHRFAFGLDTWYEANEMPVGAHIQLRCGGETGVVSVDWRGRRPKREWVRVAVPKEDGLSFEMLTRQVSCEYDDLMVIWVDDLGEIDELAQRKEIANGTITDLIRQIFPRLAKLSPQGTVHAKTLYSAINLLKRVAPGPLFAQVMQSSFLRAVGNGYWVWGE
jgi:hypothetical protein